MRWNWDPHTGKRSIRLVLGMVTIWPVIYLVLFVGSAFAGVFIVFGSGGSTPPPGDYIDLIQLEKKIQNGEIKELKITSREFEAVDRDGHAFYTFVNAKSSREELIGQARAAGADGRPRVSKIDENSSEPQEELVLPFGFFVLMGFHLLTMLLLFALIPVYIILPLKNKRLDQNMRIVWVILACTVGIFSDVVYWYLHIWRRPPASPPPEPEFT